MKKILIISHAMELGGVERSLLGLLDSIDYSGYSVDLFLLRHEGELLSLLPDQVHLLPEIPTYTVLARPMIQTLREGHGLLTAARLIGKVKAARYAEKHHHGESAVSIEYSHKYTRHLMPAIQPQTQYDACISFLTPHYFADEKVHAKKKIAWIHTDYSAIEIDVHSELNMWSDMDHIVSISDAVTNGFQSVFPQLSGKLCMIENILSKQLIQKQADETFSQISEAGKIVILSVGRFSHAKNFDNVPDICARLVSMGLPVQWYLIGYGGDEALIRRKIVEAHMEDHVIILGKKENPYPYIKACDLYVQPSRYEGKCVAVREAQMLCKPVVITKYATAPSQLEDGVDGVIVPMDNQGCAEGIAAVLTNKELMNQLKQNCSNRDYSNSKEIEKLYQLME